MSKFRKFHLRQAQLAGDTKLVLQIQASIRKDRTTVADKIEAELERHRLVSKTEEVLKTIPEPTQANVTAAKAKTPRKPKESK